MRRAPVRAAAAVLALVLTALLALVAAGPAAAHADLASTDPEDGSRLERAPAAVTLRFTEEVAPVTGGLRVLDGAGEPVATGAPEVDGPVVRVPLPADLPDGAYVVTWRVVSLDNHPVSGALAFGVGTAPEPVSAADLTPLTVTGAVLAARLGAYLALALLAGSVTLAWLLPSGTEPPRLLGRLGLAGTALGAVSALLALLLQGPYVAGLPVRDLLDTTLLAETSHTDFGGWVQIRLFVHLALLALLWQDLALRWWSTRLLAVLGAGAVAVSVATTGHAASGAGVETPLVALHALAAATWAGSLALLAVLALGGRRRSLPAPLLHRFSRVAAVAVAVVVGTGVGNSVARLTRPEDLWESSYGRALAVKVALVLAALAGGWLSRRVLRSGTALGWSVAWEATATAAVLAVTGVLAMTPPPG